LEKSVLQKFCKTRLCGTLTYIKTSGNESSREKNSHALGVAEYTAIGRDRTEYESADRGAREAVVLHSLLIEQAHAVALFQHGVTVLLSLLHVTSVVQALTCFVQVHVLNFNFVWHETPKTVGKMDTKNM